MLEIVDKVCNILELFLLNKDQYTLPELAEKAGYTIATTNRIVTKLVQRGYLNKVKKRKGYRLGSKILEFKRVSINRIELKNIVYPFLLELTNHIDETIAFTSWDNGECIQIAAIPSVHMLRVVPDEWAPIKVELYCTSLGKAILANMKAAEFNAYCSSVPMKAYTPNTIMGLKDLHNELLLIRQDGVAYNMEEHQMGVNSFSSAVKNDEGNVVGAVVVVGPSTRLTRAKMRQFAPQIKSIATKISEKLGYLEKIHEMKL